MTIEPNHIDTSQVTNHTFFLIDKLLAHGVLIAIYD